MRQTARAKRIARTVALNSAVLAASLLFAVGLAEVAVRLVAPQQLILIRPDLWQPDSTVGWVRRPNVDVRVNTGERSVRVMTDEHGFRIGESTRSGSTAVLLLGDSFMEALQVDHEQSVAGLLERELSGAWGRTVEVHNAGVAGFDPNQYLLRARTLLAERPYRLVITAIYLGNDMVTERRDLVPPRPRVERHSFRLPRSFARDELVAAWLRPLNDFLEVRSHAYILARRNLEGMRMRAGLHALAFPVDFLVESAQSPRWSVTADICADIAETAEQHGAEALFVLIPAPLQVTPAELERYLGGYGVNPDDVDLEQPNRLLTAELHARGLRSIDALEAFREAAGAGRDLYGRVDPHLSPEGHALLTQVVYEALTSQRRESPVIRAAQVMR